MNSAWPPNLSRDAFHILRLIKPKRHAVSVSLPNSSQVVLILSASRSGSMALAHHFDVCYDNVRALHEPPPSRHLRIASNCYLSGRLSKQDMVGILADARRRLLAETRESVYIESNPFLFGFLDAFGAVFDQPKVVHVVRDPRRYIPSYINFGVFHGLKRLAVSYFPFWILKPEHCAEHRPQRWEKMSQAERIAWYWTAVNSELNRGEALFGTNYLRLRFEDLFAPDRSGLRQLAEWIGLTWNPRMMQESNRKINASRHRRFPNWNEWDTALQQAVIRLTGPLMHTYGYLEHELSGDGRGLAA